MTTIRVVDPLEIARAVLQDYMSARRLEIRPDDHLSLVEACTLVDIASSLRMLAKAAGPQPEPPCKRCGHDEQNHSGTYRPCAMMGCNCEGYIAP